MSLIWLLLAVDSPCPEDTSLDALREVMNQVGEAARARDRQTFDAVFAEAEALVVCLDDVVYPVDASALHAARYLDAALVLDEDLQARELRAAESVPGGVLPSWVNAPPNAPMAEPSAWVPVAGPEHVTLFVDGVPVMARPTQRSAIVQAVGPGGEVMWSDWLDPDEALPLAFRVDAAPAGSNSTDGRALLEQITDLLASGSYDRVVALALPAVSEHPDLADSFRAAADLAQDQLARERAGGLPDLEDPYARYGRPVRRGAAKRGDDRKGLLLGFEVGAPTAVRGEWKIGGSAADGVGLRVGGNAMIMDSGSAYTGVDSNLYVDWNLTPKWQLETSLGVFFTQSGSAYPNVGMAVQYDPPSPLQVNVIGARLNAYGYLVPDVSVSFLW